MNPVIYHGALPLIISGPTESEGADGELDSLSLTVLLDSTVVGGWRAALATAGYARKTKLTGWHSMWVRSVSLIQDDETTAEVSIEAVGLLVSGEKRKRMVSNNTSTVSQSFAEGLLERSFKDAFLTLVDTYILASNAEPPVGPSTALVGTALTPPNPPTTPPQREPALGEPLRLIKPDGWVLDNREIEEIHTTGTAGLWVVTDTYGYYPPPPAP